MSRPMSLQAATAHGAASTICFQCDCCGRVTFHNHTEAADHTMEAPLCDRCPVPTRLATLADFAD